MIKLGSIVEVQDGHKGRVVFVYWSASSCSSFSYIRSVDVLIDSTGQQKNYLPEFVKIVDQE